MKRVAALLTILFVSCTNNTRVPKEYIQIPKMQKILWDMTQADRYATSFLNIRMDSLGKRKQETVDLYDKVFSFNNISREEFLKSYHFYLGRPDLMKLMYDSITAQAERRRAEIYNHPTPDFNRPRTDSAKHPIALPHDSAKRKFSTKPSLRLPHE